MKTVAIIQARMGSSRLPGKVLKQILDKPMLWYIVRRVRATPSIDQVIVAVPDDAANQSLREFCRDYSVPYFAGSELDVLDRFYGAARMHGGDPVLRITADCPLVDPELIEKLIGIHRTGRYDYASVAAGADAESLEHGRFPDGLDAECFNFECLEQAWRKATDPRDREHVTRYIWRQKDKFRCAKLFAEEEYPRLRLTVDHPQDFMLISQIYEELYDESRVFKLSEVMDLLNRNPQLLKLNQHLIETQNYRAVLEE
jgi:spore coat polysaccharide biosynthesis protein SpsF